MIENNIIELALNNIINFGDTDIFPYPIDNYVFKDQTKETIQLVKSMDADFKIFIEKYPPVNITTLVPLGYTGFRWATQIEPIWNLYFLSLVLSIAENIERVRIPIDKNIVFSYRYAPNFATGSLFNSNVNWKSFQEQSLCLAKSEKYPFVIRCDIADFYTRIYHHRLENALKRLNGKSDAPSKIMDLLQKYSNTNSYGLPIGGPASRILAELLLNTFDHILVSNSIRFCRFVDDFHVFCESIEDAHKILNLMSQKLMKNEGLNLQKSKTQILPISEFINIIESIGINEESTSPKVKFMSLNIKYDPYSGNSLEKYDEIKNEVEKFDIIGLLNQEVKKSKIHQQFSRHLLKALNVLDTDIISKAFYIIADNLDVLYPVFPLVMIAAYTNYDRLDDDAKSYLMDHLRKICMEDSYIVQVELNVAYLIRFLAKDKSYENEEILVTMYKRFRSSVLISNIIMQIMANWQAHYFISDLKPDFHTMNRWERKIFIIASFILGDEGGHWRDHVKKELSESELLIKNWASDKKKTHKSWGVPL